MSPAEAAAAVAWNDIGAHLSTAGGLDTCFERAQALGVRTAQIFVKNQRRWAAPPLAPEAARAFRDAWKRSPLREIVAHSTYLVNLAADDPEIWARSVLCIQEELGRAAALGLRGVIVHPGSSRRPLASAVERIAFAIEKAFEDPRTRGAELILETTAGAGGTIGGTFDELRAIIDAVPARLRPRIGVCLDTCHLHVAGHDVATPVGYERTLRRLEATIGLARVRAIHLNDSRRERGSRVDRHANLGEGTIGLGCFRAIVRDPRFRGVPKILETPVEQGGRERDLARLRAIVADAKRTPRSQHHREESRT